ncbi:CGNR zinc finger domain-containing protein [Lentibacillus sp. CBA3610]|nr:hypothetical protein Len3610_19125 [Lentibacillus sp. CBA3610]
MHANRDIDKLKRCANNQCLAFCVNKKGKRKWCSMDICENLRR